MKKFKVVFMVAFCVVLTLSLTVGFAAKSKHKSKAESIFDYFKKPSLGSSNCVVILEEEYYNWTGKPITPSVTVTYGGKELTENLDYTVSYSDNTDAGTASIKVKGANGYKGSKTVNFDILGINIVDDCNIIINNNKEVEIYYNGKKLDKNDYKVSSCVISKEIISSVSGVNTYEVKTFYQVYGKGKYCGYYSETITSTEVQWGPVK